MARIEFYETWDSTSTIVTTNLSCTHASAGMIDGEWRNDGLKRNTSPEPWSTTTGSTYQCIIVTSYRSFVPGLILVWWWAAMSTRSTPDSGIGSLFSNSLLSIISQLYYLSTLLTTWYWNAQEYTRQKAATGEHFINVQIKSYPMCCTQVLRAVSIKTDDRVSLLVY